jgi:hypothetical protein
MAEYNFSDPGNGFTNLPFDQVNHSSAVVIIANFQKIQEQNEQMYEALLVLVFLLAVNVGIEIVKYLKARRMDSL